MRPLIRPPRRVLAGFFAALALSISIHADAATLIWTNLSGGSWTASTNWSPNQVPTAIDTVYITNESAFTVTVATTAAVSNLFLGPGTGVVSNRFEQTGALTIHGTATIHSNGWFRMSGQLNVSNRFENAGFFQWLDSPMRGNGTFINARDGVLHTRSTGVSTIGVRTFENFGAFLVSSDDAGVQVATGTTITNHASGDIRLALPGFGIRDVSGATGTLLVNYGTIRATASVPASPSYLTVKLLNFGTLLQQTAGFYLGAGTNYGTISSSSSNHKLSTVSNDPFVFEPGTTFTEPMPRLFAGGHFLFNTPLTLSSAVLHVGDASDGASTTAPALTINADLTFTGDVDVTSGRIHMTNSGTTIILGGLKIADDGVTGNAGPYITNSTTLIVNNYDQNLGTTDNSGHLTIRTNLSFTSGNFRSDGVIVFAPGSTSTISGTGAKTFNGQTITNLGTVTATATVSFLNGASWFNSATAILNANGGTFDDTGTAGAFRNEGLVQRPAQVSAGGIDLLFTNAGGIVGAQSGLLTIGRFTQTGGRTELRGGNLGGTLLLQGGTLDGAGDVGHLVNSAEVFPGNAIGTIRTTGGFTNRSAGTYHMAIGTNTPTGYDRISVTGTAQLAGTLNVTFANGFFPTIGHAFTAMTWTARSGVFDQILTPNYEFQIEYLPNALVLRASNSLPRLQIHVSGGNTQLVCRPFAITATAVDLDGVVTNIALLVNGTPIAAKQGAVFETTFESDSPGATIIAFSATDDRSGQSVSNHPIHLATLPLHVLTMGGKRTNDFKLCMAGETGSNYLLFATTNLNEPFSNWVELGLMEHTNGIWRYLDRGTLTNRPHRFYRAGQQ